MLSQYSFKKHMEAQHRMHRKSGDGVQVGRCCRKWGEVERRRSESTDAIAPVRLWLTHTAENRWFLTLTHSQTLKALRVCCSRLRRRLIGMVNKCACKSLIPPTVRFTLGSVSWLTLASNHWALDHPTAHSYANQLFLYF